MSAGVNDGDGRRAAALLRPLRALRRTYVAPPAYHPHDARPLPPSKPLRVALAARSAGSAAAPDERRLAS